MSTAAKLMLVAPLAAACGALLPWATVQGPFVTVTIAGTDTDAGPVLIGASLVMFCFAVFAATRQWMVCYVLAALSAIVASFVSVANLLDVARLSRTLQASGLVSTHISYGLLISTVGSVGSLAALFGAVGDRDRE